MAKHILFCGKCNKYTIKDVCPLCNGSVVSHKPPKYSPEDKYGKFRREVKSKEYQAKGLI
jgi:H/ACA ribonucleoprotein complex subunit 3